MTELLFSCKLREGQIANDVIHDFIRVSNALYVHTHGQCQRQYGDAGFCHVEQGQPTANRRQRGSYNGHWYKSTAHMTQFNTIILERPAIPGPKRID